MAWVVTKIYVHFTFEQSQYKKDFVLMNQNLQQNWQNKIEKDFYKLLNNFSYGHDCSNNLGNCIFEPIFNELEEITYIKRYHNLFDSKISGFVNSELIEKKIEEIYTSELIKIKKMTGKNFSFTK